MMNGTSFLPQALSGFEQYRLHCAADLKPQLHFTERPHRVYPLAGDDGIALMTCRVVTWGRGDRGAIHAYPKHAEGSSRRTASAKIGLNIYSTLAMELRRSTGDDQSLAAR